MSTEEVMSTCDGCGASVYEQHLKNGIARKVDGRLLCAHCVAELKEAGGDVGEGSEDELAPIELDDDDGHATTEMTSTRIRTAESILGDKAWDDEKHKRPLDPGGAGASRCRTFHCRISQGAIDYLNDQINEWLDQNKDITIKSSNTVIGMFEGKHTEPNIILTVFY